MQNDQTKDIIYRSQIITGFKEGRTKHTHYGEFHLPRSLSKRDEEADAPERSTMKTRINSILSSIRTNSGRERNDDSGSNNCHPSNRSEGSAFEKNDCRESNDFRESAYTQINKTREDSSRRSWSSFYSDGHSSASVVSSVRARAREYCGFRFCCIFLGMLCGFVACGFVFQDEIANMPLVKTIFGIRKEELRTQQPSEAPSSSPTLLSDNTQSISPTNTRLQSPLPIITQLPSSRHPSEAPLPNPTLLLDESISPTNTSSQNPSIDLQRSSSMIPSFTQHPTSVPNPIFTSLPSKTMENSSPSDVPSTTTSKRNPEGAPTTVSELPTSVPTNEPSVGGCNTTFYYERKFRYRQLAQLNFYDPNSSNGSRYDVMINWLATDDYLDCETSDLLLLDKMVWALVFFELRTYYTMEYHFGNQTFVTLAGYLVKGNHCNRYDDVMYHVRQWSVACDDDGFISELELVGHERNEGELPPEIVYLAKLKKLVVTNSPNIFGTIPRGLFTLANLEHLDLTNLGLSGELFPDTFFAANNENPPSTRMKVLKLGSDASILDSWYTPDKRLLKEPKVQDISNNKFIVRTLNDYNISTFPADEIQSFQMLEELCLANANLVGTIPDFDQISSLKYLSLWGNSLGGTIPSFPTDIETIRLKANALVGNIPDGLGQCTKLIALELGNNPLQGLIPPSIADLPALKSLYLCE